MSGDKGIWLDKKSFKEIYDFCGRFFVDLTEKEVFDKWKKKSLVIFKCLSKRAIREESQYYSR